MIPRSRALVCAIAIALPGAAWGQGIRNSAHDLSNTSGTTTVKNQEAQHNQICIYCHTPHHAQSTQLLWNHSPSRIVAMSFCEPRSW